MQQNEQDQPTTPDTGKSPPLESTSRKRVNNAKLNLAERFASAQLTINGAGGDSTILGMVAPFGYSQERIVHEGGQLLIEVQQHMAEYATALGDAASARGEQKRVYTLARKSCGRDVAFARLALQDDRGVMLRLGLLGQRKEARAGWLMQAREFYSAALGDPLIQQQLSAAGLTLDRLEGGRGLIAQVDHCLVRQAATAGIVKEARQRRDATTRRLDRWMADLRTILRLALRGRPELLQRVGM
jgi:hypothetical protein